MLNNLVFRKNIIEIDPELLMMPLSSLGISDIGMNDQGFSIFCKKILDTKIKQNMY
jgi:hypothetical protein